ncbi:Serine/threonine-protein kinase TOR [Gossypium arboreum]|uniref:Serine/threonine-protein kinase TOR n=1 Tax=Gossypium arboreum TaxID=29729 RepID=A0A0B0MW61_GOSAR|nr:Serine/threonine-protein kinase TOR [Gossypium arboreum]
MLPTKGSRARPEDERDVDQRNGVGKNSSRVQKLWNAKMTIFQIYTRPFILLPTSAVEGPGNM